MIIEDRTRSYGKTAYDVESLTIWVICVLELFIFSLQLNMCYKYIICQNTIFRSAERSHAYREWLYIYLKRFLGFFARH